MLRNKPRQVWNTLRQFTAQRNVDITCTLEQQLEHWTSQGEVEEAVWTNDERLQSEQWVEWLRSLPSEQISSSPVTPTEVSSSRQRLRTGRTSGADGIPAEVLKNLPCLSEVATLLFSVSMHYAIYPTSWGIAVVRSLLEPGKPPNLASSLRGIRLLSSFAAWFGKVLDRRAREAWQPSDEQFGFREGLGCLEAVMVFLALIYSRIHNERRLFISWIDLRTAFPSLNRAILLKRMMQHGLDYGLCRLMLAILDSTYSIIGAGKFISRRFKETRGTREGAIKSPHFFNVYIAGLRERLECGHPRLCKMMSITVAILLYTDDAAIPADTPEDLQLAADIAEAFFNDSQLYVSTPKSYKTVFHPESDTGATYHGDTVSVDDTEIVIRIYGEQIKATASFKYLGVYLNEYGKCSTHVQARTEAFSRAAFMLISSLRRIPSFSFSFRRYVWNTLVVPVACYGFEAYHWDECQAKEFTKQENSMQRYLLRVGGRSPTTATQILLSFDSCSLEWRVRRVALCMRLLFSPAGSSTQAARLTLCDLQAPWYKNAFADLRLLDSEIDFIRSDSAYGPFLQATTHLRAIRRAGGSRGVESSRQHRIVKNYIKKGPGAYEISFVNKRRSNASNNYRLEAKKTFSPRPHC